MTVVVVVPGYQPWKVAGWAFRALSHRTGQLLMQEEDRVALAQAEALNGLHLDLMRPEQAARMAVALQRAAEELRKCYVDAQEDKDREFAERLGDLSLWLTELATGGG